MKTLVKVIGLIMLVIADSSIAHDCTNTRKVLSWNIKDLGQSKDTHEMQVIASLVADSDVVAIQEVVAGKGGPEAVARLLVLLREQSSDWMAIVSEKTSGEGTERYAYLWRSERVDRVDSPVSGLSTELSAGVDREPYVQTFWIGQQRTTLVNFHAVPTKKEPAHEIVQLKQLPALTSDAPVLVMGDFNLGYEDEAFEPIRRVGLRSHIRGKTALKMARKDGEHLTHPYDNVFSEHVSICTSGILDFSERYPTLKAARAISDHSPVWVTIASN
ncbi:endonuclease/exonuclease/phosphatase family protein [Vibrio europaeus]|uniref:endonuclease/exonuclease/phosphatase family protein n=1 Tax=Vibrio europaeus TaxID=300876 RepID=UPI00233E5D36|nr:endonuclease/exonuclease/phosphatase family protein [Vibrio europaeus]MDC5807979.1 endonuclease/exonuclease/phosphatase family protein [Vibrio europaeus]MDC5825480.1 endonuclease/exonuclease/phosphatase family protein [Vibrio europaeus]MDC5832768.1 endonuclease/exonuclease/phosphatase family protein [Vibrio europaeus]MDC5835679.1 endonuclease/exonuclease/phosphatase family protein [Vibrio europaeus]